MDIKILTKPSLDKADLDLVTLMLLSLDFPYDTGTQNLMLLSLYDSLPQMEISGSDQVYILNATLDPVGSQQGIRVGLQQNGFCPFFDKVIINFMSLRPTYYTLQIHATFHNTSVYQCG